MVYVIHNEELRGECIQKYLFFEYIVEKIFPINEIKNYRNVAIHSPLSIFVRIIIRS